MQFSVSRRGLRSKRAGGEPPGTRTQNRLIKSNELFARAFELELRGVRPPSEKNQPLLISEVVWLPFRRKWVRSVRVALGYLALFVLNLVLGLQALCHLATFGLSFGLGIRYVRRSRIALDYRRRHW